jgi:hypothetical protein
MYKVFIRKNPVVKYDKQDQVKLSLNKWIVSLSFTKVTAMSTEAPSVNSKCEKDVYHAEEQWHFA